MKDSDKEWFFNCVKIAQNEFLEYTTPPLDYKKVLAKAKEIFNEGLPVIKELFEETTNLVNKNVKVCPKCLEEVPENFTKHSYKKNGDKCGHVF